jgi:hypothetical protein
MKSFKLNFFFKIIGLVISRWHVEFVTGEKVLIVQNTISFDPCMIIRVGDAKRNQFFSF